MAISSPTLSTRLRSLWIPSSAQQLQAAEARVLSRVRTPFVQSLVNIDRNLYINTLHFSRLSPHQSTAASLPSATPPSPAPTTATPHSSPPRSDSSALPPVGSAPPLVLLHGFGAGAALYYGNFDSLATQVDDLYAIDMLGCGRSSRPPFTAKTTAEAESFFVDSLEQWRAVNGIDSMVLAGHSLGGYLASVYSLAHPTRVSRLILLSPVGVPSKPPGADTRPASLPFPQRALYSFTQQLWMAGVTPQNVVKWAGPWGRGFIERYVTHRFKEEARASPSPTAAQLSGDLSVGVDLSVDDVPAMDKPAVTEYLYQSLTARGSGEYALSKLLSPGAYAQQPLIDRLPQLPQGIPTTLVYGVYDWMDVRAGVAVARRLNEAGGAAVTLRVKDAGHQLMVDNVAGFDQAVRAGLTLPPVSQGERARREWEAAINSRSSHLLITE